ncbi:5-hydroxytryptamine receptor 3C-like [Myxocyprinus asiaticus]|uniref:5-hydroxytryptamine receptor 3C-like n=1 Tax=Myxocyprinus asiaticus TaxID=70543 RepID=UPI0022218A33|nr:5-hydroxytryptamine receptor 3C-like [Myxocyprinus asiaticus]
MELLRKSKRVAVLPKAQGPEKLKTLLRGLTDPLLDGLLQVAVMQEAGGGKLFVPLAAPPRRVRATGGPPTDREATSKPLLSSRTGQGRPPDHRLSPSSLGPPVGVHTVKKLMALILHSRPQVAGFSASFPQFQLIIYCFIMQSLLIQSSETINCSEPTTDALLSSLRASILGKTEVRPVLNLKTPTNISVSFTLYGILDVDEKAQVFNTFIWVYLFWKIEGLSWDPNECGTDRISLPRKKLWMPDIVINEFMDENRAPDTYYLYAYFNGQVMDDIPFHVISSCNLDIYTFPFDVQNCTFTFNSYQHTGKDIQLFFQEPVKDILKTSLDIMKTKGEWELVDMLAEKPEIPLHALNNSMDTLIYYIIIRRRATLYIVNLLIPSCFLISVDLFSFLLPPQNVDRSAFKMTLILGYTVFLLLMNDLLPATGNTLPLINVFFSLCLALMVASLLETVVITNILCGSSHYPPLPQWVKVLFLNYLARIVCLIKKHGDQNCEGESQDYGAVQP